MRGFTLIETLISMLLLVTGMVFVALLFLYSARTNSTNQQRTSASLLLQEKLDQFSITPVIDPAWISGQYSDHPSPYLRTWRISGTTLKTLTVTVYTDGGFELARATTMAAP